MGVFKGYQIEWINALTGAIIDTTEKISDIYGHLKLEFPGTLTGNATCPIMFFKLYRTDATFLAPIPSNEFETVLPSEFELIDKLDPIEITHWVDTLSTPLFEISVAPNPTNEVVKCSIFGDYSHLKWVLSGSNGQYLGASEIIDPNFVVDLSVYNNGTYYLQIQNTKGVTFQTIKLIKI